MYAVTGRHCEQGGHDAARRLPVGAPVGRPDAARHAHPSARQRPGMPPGRYSSPRGPKSEPDATRPCAPTPNRYERHGAARPPRNSCGAQWRTVASPRLAVAKFACHPPLSRFRLTTPLTSARPGALLRRRRTHHKPLFRPHTTHTGICQCHLPAGCEYVMWD